MTFAELLSLYSIETAPENHHHRRPGWEQIDCPVCNIQGHWRLGFNLRFKFFSCWSCGKLPLAETLIELTKESFSKVLELINDLDGEVSRKETLAQNTRVRTPQNLSSLLPAHRRYLLQRGFDPDYLVEQWGIKGIGVDNKLGWRIWIPITLSGVLVSWTSRAVGTGGLRYISARPLDEIVSHKTLLYGEDFARHTIIIVEGPLDVWKIGPGAVATFGTAYTQAQVQRMSRFPIRYICFDNELVAQKQALKLCNALEVYAGKTINIVLNDGKDPGDTSEKELKQLRGLLR